MSAIDEILLLYLTVLHSRRFLIERVATVLRSVEQKSMFTDMNTE